jgi:CAP-Gly domain
MFLFRILCFRECVSLCVFVVFALCGSPCFPPAVRSFQNDGSTQGKRYFSCSKPGKYGIFVRPAFVRAKRAQSLIFAQSTPSPLLDALSQTQLPRQVAEAVVRTAAAANLPDGFRGNPRITLATGEDAFHEFVPGEPQGAARWLGELTYSKGGNKHTERVISQKVAVADPTASLLRFTAQRCALKHHAVANMFGLWRDPTIGGWLMVCLFWVLKNTLESGLDPFFNAFVELLGWCVFRARFSPIRSRGKGDSKGAGDSLGHGPGHCRGRVFSPFKRLLRQVFVVVVHLFVCVAFNLCLTLTLGFPKLIEFFDDIR